MVKDIFVEDGSYNKNKKAIVLNRTDGNDVEIDMSNLSQQKRLTWYEELQNMITSRYCNCCDCCNCSNSLCADFAYFKNLSTYDAAKQVFGIDDRTICFVEEDSGIYTHGHRFGGGSGTNPEDETGTAVYTNTDGYLTINNNVNPRLININSSALKTWIQSFAGGGSGSGSSGGKTYTSGDQYINVNNTNNTISLNYSALNIPSITPSGTVDYSINSVQMSNGSLQINQKTVGTKSCTISLNDLNGVDVSNPANNSVLKYSSSNGKWYAGTDNEGTSGTSTVDVCYPYFKNVDKDEVPKETTVNSYIEDGWSSTAGDLNPNERTWAIWIMFRGETAISIVAGPIKLTGNDGPGGGEAGRDSNEIEFIFRRSTILLNPDEIEAWASELDDDYHTEAFKNDDHVPTNWHDHPEGIDNDNRYEYVSYRVSSINESGARVWGATKWSTPGLWSQWGRNGLDGDGVEYIFYTSENTVDWNNVDARMNPINWNISQEQEYIHPDWKGNNEPNKWLDDPYDLELMPAGSKTYVSIRKRKREEGEEIGTWGSYSSPTLWAYKAKDAEVFGSTVVYNVNILSNSLSESNNKTSGAASFNIMKITASSSERVLVNKWQDESGRDAEIYVYADIRYEDEEVSYRLGMDSINDEAYGFSYRSGNQGNAFITLTDVNDFEFLRIRILKDGEQIATAYIYKTRSANGNNQLLDNPVIRITQWSQNGYYYAGNTVDETDGIKYLDVVEYNGVYYKCVADNTGVEPVNTLDGNSESTYWEVFSVHGSDAFNTLLANNAYIKSLTSKQIVITDGNNEVVAGMASGSYIQREIQSDHSSDNTGGVRIWAGQITDGNVADAPFTVDYLGNLKANGEGSLANGNITWNINGDVTIRGSLKVGARRIEMVEDGLSATVAVTGTTDHSVAVQGTVTNSNAFDVFVIIQWYVDGANAEWSAQSQTEAIFVGARSTASWVGTTSVNTNGVSHDNTTLGADIISAYRYLD